MKVKKLFKIFPRTERIRIIETSSLHELYSGYMGNLSADFLKLPIDCARSTVCLEENRPMLNIYVRKAEEE